MQEVKRTYQGLIFAAISGSVLSLFAMPSHPVQAANFLSNGSFEQNVVGSSTTFTGLKSGGSSAADGWRIWNNSFATTATDLLPSTLPSGGSQMIHVDTTGNNNGLFQVFLPFNTGPNSVISSAWVYVINGKVGLGTGNGGNTGLNVISSTTGEWEFLEAVNGVSPANEFIIYSASQNGAEFYVDLASVELAPNPTDVPESSVTFGLAAIFGLMVLSYKRSK